MKIILLTLSILLMGKIAHAESIYRASIDIQGKIFQDIITIEGLPKFAWGRSTNLTGSVTVPGVFSVPLKGRFTGANMWVGTDTADIILYILALENGRKFKVRYEFKTNNDLTTISGKAFLEDGSLLGIVGGVRIFNNDW